MTTNENATYERFVAARMSAIELTDRYKRVGTNDPRRAELWEQVVRETEGARALLEEWLQPGGFPGAAQPIRRVAADRIDARGTEPSITRTSR